MKTIIVSDIHLTAKFDLAKFTFLKTLFKKCDKLIINGDFWSCYSSTFDDFISSDWKQLFPLMLEKKTTLVYGNHDRPEFMDDRVKLFSVELEPRITYSLGKYSYHIEHGHLFFKHQSISNPRFMAFNRRLKVDERIRQPFEHLLFKSIGIEHLSSIQKLMNNPIKNRSKIGTELILITGHTHIAEVDTTRKFVNTGFIDQGLGWYLELSDNGYELVKCKY